VVEVGVGSVVGWLPPGLRRCAWVSGMIFGLGSVGIQPEMVKGIFVSIFVNLFWIILAFISCGQLACYEILNVKDS
jgi:hypothetical protein